MKQKCKWRSWYVCGRVCSNVCVSSDGTSSSGFSSVCLCHAHMYTQIYLRLFAIKLHASLVCTFRLVCDCFGVFSISLYVTLYTACFLPDSLIDRPFWSVLFICPFLFCCCFCCVIFSLTSRLFVVVSFVFYASKSSKLILRGHYVALCRCACMGMCANTFH